MKDRTKHLLLAVLFTGLAGFGAYHVLASSGWLEGGVSRSVSQRTGTNISVSSGLIPLAGCLFAAGFCWWAYFKDQR